VRKKANTYQNKAGSRAFLAALGRMNALFSYVGEHPFSDVPMQELFPSGKKRLRVASEHREVVRIMDGDQEWVKIQGQIEEVLEPKLRETIERISARSEIAVPFVPYVGPAYPCAQTKILFVGKATDGWGWRAGKWDKSATLEGVNLAVPDWYETLSEIPSQFIDWLIIPTFGGAPKDYPKYPRAPFWRSIYRISSDLLFDQPIDQAMRTSARLSEGTFTSIAWTNVFKVSYQRGNPETGGDPAGKTNHRDPLIQLQEEEDLLSALRMEIEILRPKVVLFFTGPTYDPHLEKALPGISMSGSRGLKKMDGLKGLRKGGVALRTYHPGAWGDLFKAESVVRYIRECLGCETL
jgi:hypothetical protein